MRKIKFKKWINSEWKNVETGETMFYHQNPGLKDSSTRWSFSKSGYFEDDFNSEGTFHAWGFEIQDNGDQMVSDSVAIVELPDGTVQLIAPTKIKFIN